MLIGEDVRLFRTVRCLLHASSHSSEGLAVSAALALLAPPYDTFGRGMDAPAPPARSRTERRETSCMRVVRRFERENETNPREFSSLRPLLRAVDARFEEVFEEVPGDATAWVTYSVWMERLRGADGAEDIIMRGFREGHKELDKRARALLTQRIALLALHSGNQKKARAYAKAATRIDPTRCAGLLTWEELGLSEKEMSE